MRGFLAGALTLIAIQVLVRPENAKPTAGMIGTIVTGIDHFLSPAYPGLPAAKKAKDAAAATNPNKTPPTGPDGLHQLPGQSGNFANAPSTGSAPIQGVTV